MDTSNIPSQGTIRHHSFSICANAQKALLKSSISDMQMQQATLSQQRLGAFQNAQTGGFNDTQQSIMMKEMLEVDKAISEEMIMLETALAYQNAQLESIEKMDDENNENFFKKMK